MPMAAPILHFGSSALNVNNSLILGTCTSSATVSASGSLSDDHTCVGEASNAHTSVADAGDLGNYVPVSRRSGGYFNLVTGSAALGAGSSTHCLTRDQRQQRQLYAHQQQLQHRRYHLGGYGYRHALAHDNHHADDYYFADDYHYADGNRHADAGAGQHHQCRQRLHAAASGYLGE